MRCSSVTALARTACSVAPRPWRAPVLSNFSASRPLAAAVGRQRRYSEKANSSAIKPRTEIRLEYEGEEAILRALLPPLLSEQEAASLQVRPISFLYIMFLNVLSDWGILVVVIVLTSFHRNRLLVRNTRPTSKMSILLKNFSFIILLAVKVRISH